MRLGRYELVSEIGHGGMGRVYEARDPSGEAVAVKVLQGLPDLEAVERFLREARAMAAVDHANVVRVLESGAEQGRPYLVLELLRGGTLAARLERGGPLGWRAAAQIGAQIARGLAAIHAAGFVHRDLKPANVLFDAAGRAKVADLGLVRTMADGTALTETGAFVGTVQYVSPEQANGSPVDGRSDLYALGCVLYACLSGSPPFTGDGLAVVKKHGLEAPEPLRGRAPGVPAPLEALVHSLLAKAPDDRPPAALDVAVALERCAAAPEKGPAFGIGAPIEAVASAVIALVVIAFVIGTVRRGAARPPPPAPGRGPAPVVTGSSGAAKAAAERAERALEHALAGRPEEAIALADLALEAEPRNVLALVARGRARGHTDLEAGIRDLDRALELDAKDRGALRARGELRMKNADLRGALADDEALILLEPEDAAPWLARAQARWALGDRPGAFADLEKSLSLRPTGKAYAERARWYIEMKNFKLAEGDIARALDLRDEAEHGLYARSWLRGRLGDYQKALEDLDAALARAPRHLAARKHRCLIRFQVKDRRGSIEDLDEVMRQAPWDAGALAMRAVRRLDVADLDGALEDATRACRLGPRLSNAWQALAVVNRVRGDAAGAIAAATKTIELAPDDPLGWFERAAARARAGRLEEALGDYDRSIALSPEPTALNGRGWIRTRRGDLAGAIDDATRALRVSPAPVEGLEIRAYARLLAGDHEGAISDASRAIAVFTESEAWATRGLARGALGRTVEALPDLERAAALPSLDPALGERVRIALADLRAKR